MPRIDFLDPTSIMESTPMITKALITGGSFQQHNDYRQHHVHDNRQYHAHKGTTFHSPYCKKIIHAPKQGALNASKRPSPTPLSIIRASASTRRNVFRIRVSQSSARNPPSRRASQNFATSKAIYLLAFFSEDQIRQEIM